MFRIVWGAAFLLWLAAPAAAQIAGWTSTADRTERIGENHYRLSGNVVLKRGDTELYADVLDAFTDESRAVATGNVLFTQGTNRISADRAEFNTKTRLGTFYNASGMATFQPPRQPLQRGGFAAPQLTGQDNDVYFFGEMVEKVAAQKYRITHGGFTTCVQPTPRWDLHAGTVMLHIDHYTMLRDAVLKVKGVPLLYLPFMYYPTKRDPRATGFLIPTYSNSTLRGQSIHDAFFWAIDRSQDATFMHDWYSKTGQGLGSEYRYNFGPASNGDLSAYWLDEHEATYLQPNGTEQSLPASRSFEIRGNANQELPFGLRARGQVSYFSDLTTMQTFNTNIYDATRNRRTFGGNVVGAWGTYTLNGTFDHTEYFYSSTNSSVSGGVPRIAFSRNERPLFGDLYFTATGEYARLLYENKRPGSGGSVIDYNAGLTRFDLRPQIRFPFTKWQWFTVNSSLSWRDTYYSRSYTIDPTTGAPVVDPVTRQNQVADENLNRRYYTIQAQLVGPVFDRIWDTPGNGYAEKFKHTIEPSLNIQRTSAIDNYNNIVKIDGTDTIVGGTTLTYGLTNRFYAKQRLLPGQPAQAREIVDVSVTQSYYTNQFAARVDQQYVTSYSGVAPSHYSPLALAVRAIPTDRINATMRAEFDSRYRALRQISASGTYSLIGILQASAGWSKQGYIKELPGYNNPLLLTQAVNGSVNLHTRNNRVGGLYAFNYDVRRGAMMQQQVQSFYNAQCCGIAFEYQTYNFAGLGAYAAVPADHRFFLSFTLAGLGNFSPFSGAMNGVPR
ncbi:MAG: LPS-assembly protein LptD [Betaproteobacteria bacterium]